ncbi:unnamed protein product [Albugo candida]|uniref:Uncharacterized protein n=1 Tax=Albugo candida TaxID=65357 RepID=A0A024G2G6_9STRA|nr:unnamed protein product [Albugo candida]|eukprot:CCI40498.1 unnamed protein product [Albugo candida]
MTRTCVDIRFMLQSVGSTRSLYLHEFASIEARSDQNWLSCFVRDIHSLKTSKHVKSFRTSDPPPPNCQHATRASIVDLIEHQNVVVAFRPQLHLYESLILLQQQVVRWQCKRLELSASTKQTKWKLPYDRENLRFYLQQVPERMANQTNTLLIKRMLIARWKRMLLLMIAWLTLTLEHDAIWGMLGITYS